MILSINTTLGEKDGKIADLTGKLSKKSLKIKNLTDELDFYKEKQYIQEINNQYYDISNYFEKIENKFFPIEISISILSLALLSVIIKVFNLHLLIRRIFRRKNKIKEPKEE